MELTDPQPIVSVIIPCFNQGRFVRDAIDSSFQQAYPAVETIVIDDGSTDDTADVVRRCGAARLIAQRNQGSASARNEGLRGSRGEYIVFLDADDRLLPHAIATGVASLQAHPDWGFVAGHVRLIDEDGSPTGEPPPQHADDSDYVGLLRSNDIWTPGAVMYRRTALDEAGAFEAWGAASQDYELNLRIARRFAFGCHHQVILEYRRHRESMSADARLMLKSAVTVRRAQRPYARHDPEAARALGEGLAIVRADYGRLLIEQAKGDLLTRGRRGRALAAMLCLLRYDPRGLVRMLSDGARRLSPAVFRDLRSNPRRQRG